MAATEKRHPHRGGRKRDSGGSFRSDHAGTGRRLRDLDATRVLDAEVQDAWGFEIGVGVGRRTKVVTKVRNPKEFNGASHDAGREESKEDSMVATATTAPVTTGSDPAAGVAKKKSKKSARKAERKPNEFVSNVQRLVTAHGEMGRDLENLNKKVEADGHSLLTLKTAVEHPETGFARRTLESDHVETRGFVAYIPGRSLTDVVTNFFSKALDEFEVKWTLRDIATAAAIVVVIATVIILGVKGVL